jgi:hypothetical protein
MYLLKYLEGSVGEVDLPYSLRMHGLQMFPITEGREPRIVNVEKVLRQPRRQYILRDLKKQMRADRAW